MIISSPCSVGNHENCNETMEIIDRTKKRGTHWWMLACDCECHYDNKGKWRYREKLTESEKKLAVALEQVETGMESTDHGSDVQSEDRREPGIDDKRVPKVPQDRGTDRKE